MNEGSFNVRKWYSNSQELMTLVDLADGNAKCKMDHRLKYSDQFGTPVQTRCYSILRT